MRAAVASATALLVAAFLVTFAPGASAASGWRVVPSPNPGPNVFLDSVAASGPGDVWAAGYSRGAHDVLSTLVEHWNGSTWSVVPSKNGGPGSAAFGGVAAIAPDDAWSVGDRNANKTLTEHWDGTAWSIVPSPNVGGIGGLSAVDAVSTDDVWAVGRATDALIEHWDGRSWNVVRSPKRRVPLYGVSAISSSDVWAVGENLVEHWNGSTWQVATSAADSELFAVGMASASNGWAVGRYDSVQPDRTVLPLTRIEHWDGSAWSVVPSPNATIPGKPIANILYGVAVASSTDVWAVGVDYDEASGSYTRVLLEHWDGSAWSIVKSPKTDPPKADLAAAVTISPTDVWGVGHTESTPDVGADQTLTEHFSG